MSHVACTMTKMYRSSSTDDIAYNIIFKVVGSEFSLNLFYSSPKQDKQKVL